MRLKRGSKLRTALRNAAALFGEDEVARVDDLDELGSPDACGKGWAAGWRADPVVVPDDHQGGCRDLGQAAADVV